MSLLMRAFVDFYSDMDKEYPINYFKVEPDSIISESPIESCLKNPLSVLNESDTKLWILQTTEDLSITPKKDKRKKK